MNKISKPRFFVSLLMNSYPISALKTETARAICHTLNRRSLFQSTSGYLRDWHGLIDYLSLNVNLMLDLEKDDNPSARILDIWQCRTSVTIQMLNTAFEAIGRCDLDFPYIRNAIERDLIDYEHELKSNDSRQLDQNEQLFDYDGLVLCSDEDIDFVRDLIDSVDKNFNLKYTLTRNLNLDVEKDQEAILNVIFKKCNRLVVILSKSFVQNAVLMFYVNSAISWMLDQRADKVVPVLYNVCDVPESLQYFTILNYERLTKAGWFWERLYASVAFHPYDKQHIRALPFRLQLKIIRPTGTIMENNVTIYSSILEVNPGQFTTLVHILEIANSWKKLVDVLPSCLVCYRQQNNIDNNGDFVCLKTHGDSTKFLTDNAINTIKIESKKESRPCSELLLYEWSTYGPPVPTINDLIYVLNSVKLYRAVDFIQGDILKGETVSRLSVDKSQMDESINRFKFKKVLLLKLHKMLKL